MCSYMGAAGLERMVDTAEKFRRIRRNALSVCARWIYSEEFRRNRISADIVRELTRSYSRILLKIAGINN